jgi:hypothetical protein
LILNEGILFHPFITRENKFFNHIKCVKITPFSQ